MAPVANLTAFKPFTSAWDPSSIYSEYVTNMPEPRPVRQSVRRIDDNSWIIGDVLLLSHTSVRPQTLWEGSTGEKVSDHHTILPLVLRTLCVDIVDRFHSGIMARERVCRSACYSMS